MHCRCSCATVLDLGGIATYSNTWWLQRLFPSARSWWVGDFQVAAPLRDARANPLNFGGCETKKLGGMKVAKKNRDFGFVSFGNNGARFERVGGCCTYYLRGEGQLTATTPPNGPTNGDDYNTYLRIQINDVAHDYVSECNLMNNPFDRNNDGGSFHCSINKWYASGDVHFEYTLLHLIDVPNAVVGMGGLTLTKLKVPAPGVYPKELPWRAHGHRRFDDQPAFSGIKTISVSIKAGSESVTNGGIAGRVQLIGLR